MTSNKSDKSKKRQLNPSLLIWIAIFFFVIDNLAFQKPTSTFIQWLLIDYLAFPQLISTLLAWLLVVIPLSLVAIAFLLWGLRGQFPWLNFPYNPFLNTLSSEDNNAVHAFMVGSIFVFMAVMATIVFFSK